MAGCGASGLIKARVAESPRTFCNPVNVDYRFMKIDGGDGIRWHVNDRRRVHVYERCSQFSILQRLPTAYMWASPMPRRALEQYHLVLKKCPAQRQQMRDVLVYPDKGRLRPEEQAFVDLLHKEAASTVK